MSWILLTNDDGPASPALLPFALALGEVGEVRVVAPDRERSWSAKAVTRYRPLQVSESEVEGVTMVTVSGYPADAVQVGAVYFDDRPRLVVSGINLGYNFSAIGALASGTIGAVFEARALGLPGVAFSAEGRGPWHQWYERARSPESSSVWDRLAGVCARLLADIVAADLPGDVINVNVPWDAGPDTPRRLAPLAPVTYGQLHERNPDGTFSHRYRADRQAMLNATGCDTAVSLKGEIAITPILLPSSPPISKAHQTALEPPTTPTGE